MSEHEQNDTANHSSTSDVIDSVRELISMMNDGGISELDVSAGDVNIRLRSQAASVAQATTMMAMPMTAPMMMPPMSGAYNGDPAGVGTHAPSTESAAPAKEGHVVIAPMIGTYYSAPAPGENAFVIVGDEIEVGQVIGIIEAMKIMNEITSDQAGVVTEILVENAQAVEYGSPLVRIAKSRGLD